MRTMSADEADDHHSEHGDDSAALVHARQDHEDADALRYQSAEILADMAKELGLAADAEALQANQVEAWTEKMGESWRTAYPEAMIRRDHLAEAHREECAILRRRQQAAQDGAEALGWKSSV